MENQNVRDTAAHPSNPANPANSGSAPTLSLVDGVLSLSQLSAQLQVSAQTIYDLRSQGRGPRGFRVGRELRFRVSEIEAWLTRLESDDDRRQTSRSS